MEFVQYHECVFIIPQCDAGLLRRFLLNRPAQFLSAAINVDAEESRAAVGAGCFVLVDHRPDDLAVGVGDRERLDIFEIVPAEFALVHVPINDFDRDHDAVVEQEPVGLAFEGGFCDEPYETDVVDVDMDPGFFRDFTLGALGWGFSEMHLEFATDWGAEPLVGFFDAMEKEDASVFVAEITQARELVWQRVVGGVFGESGQNIGGIAHGLR